MYVPEKMRETALQDIIPLRKWFAKSLIKRGIPSKFNAILIFYNSSLRKNYRPMQVIIFCARPIHLALINLEHRELPTKKNENADKERAGDGKHVFRYRFFKPSFKLRTIKLG